jgi:hypothetical protein
VNSSIIWTCTPESQVLCSLGLGCFLLKVTIASTFLHQWHCTCKPWQNWRLVLIWKKHIPDNSAKVSTGFYSIQHWLPTPKLDNRAAWFMSYWSCDMRKIQGRSSAPSVLNLTVLGMACPGVQVWKWGYSIHPSLFAANIATTSFVVQSSLQGPFVNVGPGPEKEGIWKVKISEHWCIFHSDQIVWG